MSPIQVKKLHTLTGHRDCIYTMCSYDDSRFFSSGGDGMVVLWDLKTPEVGQMIVKIPASVYAMDYNHSRKLLVVGQNFSGIHLVDVDQKREVGSLSLTQAAIFDIKTTNEFIYVSTASGELFQTDWNLRVLQKCKISDQSARVIALAPGAGQLAVGSSDCMIRIFDPELHELQAWPAHAISVFALRYHPHLPLLLSGSRDARLKLWDADRKYAPVEEVVAHMYAINDLYFSPSGLYFATCSMDKSVKVWDAHEFRLLKVIDKARHAGHATSVNKLLWMNYRDWLVSCSDDRTISVWEILTER